MGQFDTPFGCPECARAGLVREPQVIRGLDDWIAHVREAHSGGQIPGAIATSGEAKGEGAARSALSSRPTTAKYSASAPAYLSRDETKHKEHKDDGGMGVDFEWEWDDMHYTDEHHDEEFWVDGRN